eukprot:Plantae.Rhodophyta-Hildenbrandia_rubra.ctg1159.p1 GENE.Plantae.Rhodophyta-Hildenbrandia_rubra.ctg1159~~Plantae.Rhodophyta-Hildenbrandia_rubra.ctg1159.p1  ORF type:complete len:514 (+),score=69.16 Plantae.Rhodophyta-Hildenbrandia_rubra.ctg1159:2193-3734(+)
MDQVKLATLVASDHFGPVVASVVRLLLLHPKSTVQRVTLLCPSDDKLPHHVVQRAIAVLLQHNIAEHHTAVGASDASYSVNATRIILRCRFPEFIRVAESEYNELGASITKLFFERGQLTAHDLMMLLRKGSTVSNEFLADVEETLLDMVKDGFLRRAGRVKGPLALDLAGNDDPYDSRRGIADDEEEDEDVVVDDFSRQDVDWVFVGGDEREDRREKVLHPKINDARTIWRISFWYLTRFMRLSVCANVVKAQLRDPDAVKVISAAMRYALTIEDQRQPTDDFRTPLLSFANVKAYMDEMLPPESTIDQAIFLKKVEEMASEDCKYVSFDTTSRSDGCRVEIAHLVCLVREETVDNIILMKAGKYGKRIFRSLVRCGNLEEDMVADKAMMPLKAACAELYKLYGMNLIYRREVPKSNEIRAQNCYYLWGVDMERVYKKVAAELYHTTCNLFIVLERQKAAVARCKHPEERTKLQRQVDLLELQILRTDHAVMLFRDLGPFENTVLHKQMTTS